MAIVPSNSKFGVGRSAFSFRGSLVFSATNRISEISHGVSLV